MIRLACGEAGKPIFSFCSGPFGIVGDPIHGSVIAETSSAPVLMFIGVGVDVEPFGSGVPSFSPSFCDSDTFIYIITKEIKDMSTQQSQHRI